MRNKLVILLVSAASLAISVQSCKPDSPPEPIDGTQPTAFTLDAPGGWPTGNYISENPLTNEGVSLGRYLFYEKALSINNTQSCASCHNQNNGFTDHENQFSTGAEGVIGTRNAMTLFNLNWSDGYFWDGRQPNLESLAGEPIEAPHEMNLSLDEAVKKIKSLPDYTDRFEKAFPGKGITTTTIRYAIAQFVRSITSYQSKWDEYKAKTPQNPAIHMTESEKRGFNAFLDEQKGDCFHCHQLNSPFIIDLRENQFANNGLDAQPDSGLARVTGDPNDIGKFKTPSLRNLAYTAPYMHDGRFATLEDVLAHYDHDFKYSPTIGTSLTKHIDQNQQPVPRLSAQDIQDIIAFLNLMNDPTLLTNPNYSDPN